MPHRTQRRMACWSTTISRSLDDDPIRALAELGRLDASGMIEIRDGLVWSHVAFGNR